MEAIRIVCPVQKGRQFSSAQCARCKNLEVNIGAKTSVYCRKQKTTEQKKAFQNMLAASIAKTPYTVENE